MDLGNVVDAAVETIPPAASAKDISVHVSVDPASRTMTGDATRLQQVAQFDGLRILIVDDDRESCEMMFEALRRYGASVQCALSATEATARLLEFRPISS